MFSAPMFSNIFHRFSKNCIAHQLKKPFSKSFFAFFISSVFISIHGFSQDSMQFFNTNSWFRLCFKFLMCITYSSLSCKFATSISLFSNFILPVKKVKQLWRYVDFQDVEHQLPEKLLHIFHHYSFLPNIHWIQMLRQPI